MYFEVIKLCHEIKAPIVEKEAASEIGLDQWVRGATRTPSLDGEKEKSKKVLRLILVDLRIFLLNPQRSAETPGAVIRICTVVIDKDMVISPVPKNCATVFPYFRRSIQPA